MSAARLAVHQFRFDQKVFWRNPASVFFTVMLPLIFLFIFATIFGNDEIEERGVKTTTYYVPAIVALAVISATMQSLAINLTQDRERGLLKRVRGTPLPPRDLRRGPGRQLARGLGADGRPGRGDRAARLRRLAARTRRMPGGAGDARGRRVRLLLPRLRADRGDPVRGRGARRSPTRRCCRSTSSPASSSPTARSPSGVLAVRRPVPDPPLLRGVLHRLGPEHDRRRASSGATWRSSPRWGIAGLLVALFASSAGSRAAEATGSN